MAGKNLCPYKDGGDNLGKKGKAWGNTHTKNLYVTGEAEVQTLEVQTLTVGDTATIPGYVKDVTKNGNTITVTKGEGESTTFNAGLNILARNKSYSVGSIAYSPNLPSYLYLECTTAGTTGATEPDMSTVSGGAILNDGTAQFTVKTVCAKEYVDSKSDNEAKKWKAAYNTLRKHSVPTEFDDAELTLLTNKKYGVDADVTLSQPYTNFDGLLIEYTGSNQTILSREYISTAEITKRVELVRSHPGQEPHGFFMINGTYYWSVSCATKYNFSPAFFPNNDSDTVLFKIYGVKFKEIT